MPDRPPELRALTGARGLAAWLVVLYHIRAAIPGLPPFAEALLAKGYLAVDLFFILSGFVLWISWGDRFARDGRAAAMPFIKKRIARVWPLHAAVLAATVARNASSLQLLTRPRDMYCPAWIRTTIT